MNNCKGKLIIFTGASGAGKTSILSELQSSATLEDAVFLHFDSIGVPDTETMIAEFGSPEEWQRCKTLEWMQQIKQDYLPKSTVIFEGQMRIFFVKEALKATELEAQIILIDCDDKIRHSRLQERGQPELADQTMMNWAAYLRNEALQNNLFILDTGNLSRKETTSGLLAQILNHETI